jgi:hypothetical protein
MMKLSEFIPPEGLPEGAGELSVSAPVARWLLNIHRRGEWDALLQWRNVRVDDGSVLRFRPIYHVDQVLDEDLVDGRGVDAVFRRVAERLNADDFVVEDHRILHAPPKWKLYPCMKVLNTADQIIKEVDHLRHWANLIVPVRMGISAVLSIDVLGHRSLVELTWDGREVLRHFAEWGDSPHPLCERVLDRFLRRNRLAQYGGL